MRILSIDEIPTSWRDVITEHWLARYTIFSDDINAYTVIQKQSVQNVANILFWNKDSKFPYYDLKICKSGKINLKLLNNRNHMWVLVQDEDSDLIQFIQGRLRMDTEIDCSDIGTELTL